MGEYKYRIVHDTNWHFELLPNNNNQQYVAKSNDYQTMDEALDGIRKLKSYIGSNPEIDVQECVFQNGESETYCKRFAFSEGEYICTRKYFLRKNSNKGIQNIMKHYNSSLRSDLSIL